MVGLGLLGVSAPAQYSDSFEGPLNGDFWSTYLRSGYIVCPSKTRAHSGINSMEFVTSDTGLDKSVDVYHEFPAPTYGTVSVWVYDTAADNWSGNGLSLSTWSGGQRGPSIGTADYDLGPGGNGSTYLYSLGGDTYASAIDRTQAWHLWSISFLPNSLTIKIDNSIVSSGPGGQQLGAVQLGLGGPSWRPAWSAQFDDFSFTPLQTPPTSNAGGPYIVEASGAPTSVRLDGTASADPTGGSLTFLWTTDCPGATFDNPASPTPTLIFDSATIHQTYKVTLTVKNPSGQSSTCSTSITVRAQPDFIDNFEGPLDTSFWSTDPRSGYVVCPSSTRNHTGSHSLELVTTDTGLDKNVLVYHQFPAPTYGTLSVWVYDTGADIYSGNYISLLTTLGDQGYAANIGTADYDLGPGGNGSTYACNARGNFFWSTVDRTQGWHLFSIVFLPEALTLRIDNSVVYSGPGGQQFDRVMLGLGGPSWRPAWTAQFDDLCFQPANTPPVAKGKDVTVPADSNCSATASVDDGSFDPDGDPITITQTPAGPYPLGKTTVTLTVTDSKAASSSCTATVTVQDKTPPTLNCPADISLPCSVDALVPVSFAATATDNCDSAPIITYSKAPGSGFPVGATQVTCVATDASGNQSSGTFTVTRAALGFTGFLAPIGGADATGGSFVEPLRTFKLNSTIPAKFTASCNGSPVITGIHTLQAVKWSDATDAAAPIDATPTDAATTGNQFRLVSGSQWQFNLDAHATGMSIGKWQLIATLSDGSQHSGWVQIK